MATDLVCEVQLWGQRVGALSEDDGRVSFQYDPEFARNKLEISPFEMPLSERIYSHSNRDPAFQGLMGVFADSLPDKFGNAIIEHYFRNKTGSSRYELSPVQKLLYVGKRAMGALEYLPPEQERNDRSSAPLEIAQLVEEARQVIQGDLHVKSADIIQVGVSAGGQYPKAVIAWNQDTNDVIAGLGESPEGYSQWIIKFDGAMGQAQEFGKLEYAYSLMAKAAGIEMASTFLLKENGRHHYMVQRFDRTVDNEKLHMTTLCGLMHRDYNIPRLLDYEDYLRATLALTRSQKELQKAFRRMVFNVVARNQDDHTKNFSFLMNREGRWEMSPAYDVTYAFGTNFTAQHQMTINNQSADVTMNDIISLAKKLSIQDSELTIEEVTNAASDWPKYAQTAAISKPLQNEIYKNFRLFK